MQFIFAAAAGQAVSDQLGVAQDGSTSASQSWTGAPGRGRDSLSGGRGTSAYGNARDAHWTHDSNHTTDAVVLGGPTGPEAEVVPGKDSQMNLASPNRNVGSGGRMQRIGDKWLFVRESVEMTSW